MNNKALILAELLATLDRVDDRIVGAQMPYSMFVEKLALLAAETQVMQEAQTSKPQGMATIVQEVAPMDNFPLHEEDYTR